MYLIVGIDTGKTCGLACLDLNGHLVFSEHRLFGGSEWLINTINSIGTPVITASDKPEPSQLVRKVNAAFNARLFCPERDFRLEAKKSIARNTSIKDPHERDAYAAAITAYKSYANKFQQAEHLAQQRNYGNAEEIKAKIVGKYSMSEALEKRKANRK